MLDIFLFDGKRIGTVGKFAGATPDTRWQAFASNDRSQGFPTKKEAIAWLEKLAAEDAGHAQ